MTPDEIAADRAVIDAATSGPGPWTAPGYEVWAAFIAAARTGWPRALDALEAAWAEVERLRDERDAVSLTAERMTSYARKAEAAIARVRALCDPSVGMATACRPGVRHLDADDVRAALEGEGQ